MYMHMYINTLKFYLCVCPCVTDVGVALRISGSCAKLSRAFQLSQKWLEIFLELLKAAAGRDTLRWAIPVYKHTPPVGTFLITSRG